MVSVNCVFLAGNLTKDPELRYTPQGTPVITLRLAVNTMYKDKNGEAKKDTCFVNVVAWGQSAELCNQYLSKGSPVFIEGRLQSRSWQDATGKNKSVIEVRAQRIQFLSAPSRESTSPKVDLGPQDTELIELKDDLENMEEVM